MTVFTGSSVISIIYMYGYQYVFLVL